MKRKARLDEWGAFLFPFVLIITFAAASHQDSRVNHSIEIIKE